MTKDVAIRFRFRPREAAALNRYARRRQAYPAQVGAQLVCEGLRRAEYAGIDFRDTPAGRLAFLTGHRLAVWQVAQVVRECGGDPRKAARTLALPPLLVAAAMNYANDFADEINPLLADADAISHETLKRLLPGLEVVDG
ncbi:MAG TPA: transcriptional regulator [Verrucomicrobiota bacterium]|nr:transcriptional regulator [Verrucomicrobiales bacterium]HRI11568.1 transcriptional regulator [Verrucomicrobiota bacterium]